MRFSEAAKSNVDVLVPTLGAGIAFYFLKEKQGVKLERLLIYTAMAWVILYLLTSKITKSLRNTTTAPVDISRTNPNEQTAVGNFNASAYSDRLYKDINGIRWGQIFGTGTDDALYKELEVMSNDQLIQVANQYKKDYYSRLGESLVQSLEGETYNNFLSGTQDRVNNILRRLRALGF